MNGRLAGLALFLPVPLVLWLFTRFPAGVGLSLGIGVALMATHRLYARPFALVRAASRCLWCGGQAGDALPLAVREPLGTTAWRACRPAHLDRLRRVFGWAEGHKALLQVGVLGALALFLPGALASARGVLPVVRPDDCVAFFRLSVALSVLPLGWLAARAQPTSAEPVPVPFPVHIQALIGTWAVLGLFRVVGVVWLALALRHFAARLGLA